MARVETAAREQFGKLVEIKPVDNPLQVYRLFAGRVMAWMETLDQLVSDLKSLRYQGGVGEDGFTGTEQIRGEVQVFERAMDRANTVLATYARLGIDERLARVSEAQAAMVLRAFEAGLSAIGVAGPQAVRAKQAAARRLRLIGDGDAA